MVKLKLPTSINQRVLPCFNENILELTSTYSLNLPELNIYEGLNYIDILSPDEPKHSKILGSLLNPKGQHGFQKTFLSLFFSKVLSDDNFIDENTDKWNVTIEKERFDVRIRNQNNSKVIILENKSNWANDQPNQLYRYWYEGLILAQNQNVENNYSKILYISPDYEKKPDGQTTTRPKENQEFGNDLPKQVPDGIVKVVYFRREIYSWLDECLKYVGNNLELYYYIKQYRDFWG